jgi:hypothetical protein
MKRTFVFLSFIVFLISTAFASTTEIELVTPPTPPGPKPLSLTYYPVSATISETDLAVYFDYSVGTATITIYDASNQIIDQEIVNTNETTEVYIPTDLLDSGDYTLKVCYSSTSLIGNFQIP